MNIDEFPFHIFIFGFCDICDICLIFSVTFVIFSVTFSVTFVIFAWYFISFVYSSLAFRLRKQKVNFQYQ